jgi:hypothetical protein
MPRDANPFTFAFDNSLIVNASGIRYVQTAA